MELTLDQILEIEKGAADLEPAINAIVALSTAMQDIMKRLPWTLKFGKVMLFNRGMKQRMKTVSFYRQFTEYPVEACQVIMQDKGYDYQTVIAHMGLSISKVYIDCLTQLKDLSEIATKLIEAGKMEAIE